MNSEADDAGRAAEAAQIRLSEIAKPGDFFMKMVEDENPHGGAPRSITFVGIEFSPLDYDKLANTRLHEHDVIAGAPAMVQKHEMAGRLVATR